MTRPPARWRKLGRSHDARPLHDKLLTHAANPLAVPLAGDVFRVFFSGRDARKRSSVGFVDLDVARNRLVGVCDAPVLEHGAEGSFYADGVSVGACYVAGGRRYMLFMAWQNPPGAHWRGDIGRLVVHDDLSLSIDSDRPLLGASAVDPISLSYPWVARFDDGAYRMWYGSTITWDAGNGDMLHVINAARSDDGDRWDCDGLAIPFKLGEIQAFSRPTVAGSSTEGYRMWFSYRGGRGSAYRIGAAASRDGRAWELQPGGAGIDVSTAGWDAEMIEYPCVFRHSGATYMLYNGNGFGATGFGLAILD